MHVSRESGIALWRQIRDALATEIAEGALPLGARIPTETVLAARFAVNRHTVRRAVAELAEEGLIRIERGRGMFVQEPVVHYEVGKRTRFTENLAHQVRVPEIRVVDAICIPADGATADALAIAPESPVVLVRRLGSADGRPISLSAHHFCAQRFGRMQELCWSTHSITEALKQLGVVDYERKVTRLTARMPSRREAKLLMQPESHPVLIAESVNVDRDARPIEYGVTAFCSDRVQIVFEP